MVSYEIVFGEFGFDVLRNGQLCYVNVESRIKARALVSEARKSDRTREMARQRVRILFEGLRDDYGLPASDLVDIFRQEARP